MPSPVSTPRRFHRAILWSVLAVSAAVVIAAGGGLFYVAQRAEKRWDEVIAYFDSRMPAIERRFSALEWWTIQLDIETVGYVKSPAGTWTPTTPPIAQTPWDLAWWQSFVHSNREESYDLNLGFRDMGLSLILHQERHWFTSELQARLVCNALDDERKAILRELFAEVDVPLTFDTSARALRLRAARAAGTRAP